MNWKSTRFDGVFLSVIKTTIMWFALFREYCSGIVHVASTSGCVRVPDKAILD